jgi:hypothetical protein
MLTADDLGRAFMELGALARAEGKVIDLAVYGGSALMLASNFRMSTRDVDAVAEKDQSTVNRLARAVASRHGWPADWLNDGVRAYLSPNVEGLSAHHRLFRGYPCEEEPGLRVFVPSAEYVLAMKLMAMRIDPAAGGQDAADILNLLDVVGLKTAPEAIAFASGFYPEAKISGRLHLGISELMKLRADREQEGLHVAPAYLGGGRPAS